MELFTRWTTHETNPNVPSGGRFEGKRKPLVTWQYPAGRQKAGQTSRMSFWPRLEMRTPVPSCSLVQPSPPGLEGKAAWSSRADACGVLLNYWTARWQVFWGLAGGNVAPYWHLPSASDWGLKWEFHGRESSVLRDSQSLTYIYIRSFSFKKNYLYEFGLPLPPKFWKGNFFRYTCEIILINLQNTLDCDHYQITELQCSIFNSHIL